MSGPKPDETNFWNLMLLFVGLKLAGVIDWHWAWVVSPPILLPIANGICQAAGILAARLWQRIRR